MLFRLFTIGLLCFLASCKSETTKSTEAFLKEANEKLKKESHSSSVASWVHANFITEDTTMMSSEYNARFSELVTQYAIESKKYTGKTEDDNRMLNLLLKVLTVPAPNNSEKNTQLATLKSELESMYGSGKYCNDSKECKDLGDLEEIISTSRDPQELLNAWKGWRTVSMPMKEKYQKTVELGNEGSRDLGFKNMADLWRSNYDMAPEDFEKDLDRIWSEVKPFYEQLHCFVRGKLNKKYGDNIVKNEGGIPAHLLGNMWAQSWENIGDIVGVDSSQSVDITDLLKKASFDSVKMVKTAENFFVSLGMPQLPETFYKRSLFEKPQDRDVVCHASAWHMDLEEDVRIKMCIKIDEDNFRTIHHELGHIYYYLAYKELPAIYQGSANDGFHEALGDTIELSITANYLKEIALLKSDKVSQDEINHLLRMALTKVAFLPFGLMIDKWRWQVFDGRVTPENYNQAWWNLRKEYQGLIPPEDRPAEAFDPGAKYHIPAYTPYSRYFIAHILQFQFHKALCETAGFNGPLHQCSVYNSKEAGQKLWSMMKLGTSKPWPVALEAVTGNKNMDATALRSYFAPLEKWLIEQNKGQSCGWN